MQSAPALVALGLIIILLCAADSAAQPPGQGQAPRPTTGATKPNVTVDMTAAEPLTSYEADAGPFHVKLESGTAQQTSSGKKLSGGEVSIWLKSDPSKKITVVGADLTVKERMGAVIGVNGTGESLRGFGTPALALEEVALNMPNNGDRLTVRGNHKAHGLEFRLNLNFTNTGLAGEGSIPVLPNVSADADGWKVFPLGPVEAAVKGAVLIAQYTSMPGMVPHSYRFKSEEGFCRVPCPPASFCPAPWPNLGAVWKEGNITFQLPEPSAISAAAAAAPDVKKEAREACLALAKKIPQQSLRDKAVAECNSKNPFPTSPTLPPSVTVKAKDLVQ